MESLNIQCHHVEVNPAAPDLFNLLVEGSKLPAHSHFVQACDCRNFTAAVTGGFKLLLIGVITLLHAGRRKRKPPLKVDSVRFL